jgi:ribose 5-phosphate isomerase A
VLDLAIDGADQIANGSLALIKGYGGALLREKLVAAAARSFVVIADDSKLAEGLDKKVPVEVVRFGWQSTDLRIRALGASTELRRGTDGAPYVTDGGNYILDAMFGKLPDPAATDAALRALIGVVETGLFVGMASQVLLASPEGVVTLNRR